MKLSFSVIAKEEKRCFEQRDWVFGTFIQLACFESILERDMNMHMYKIIAGQASTLFAIMMMLLVSGASIAAMIPSRGVDLRDRASQGDQAAVSQLLAAARSGDSVAEYFTGVLYDFGYGVAADPEQAAIWYRRAAEQGHVEAQLNLGLMYADGRQGVARNGSQAAYWLREAANQNNAVAQYSLGVIYFEGHGVQQSDQQAVYWYSKAANNNLADAQYSLAWMYSQGRGVGHHAQQNVEASIYWLKRAAQQGNQKAQQALQRIRARPLVPFTP